MRSSDSIPTSNNSSNLTRAISNGTSAPIPIPGPKNSPKSPKPDSSANKAPIVFVEMPELQELTLPSLLPVINATKEAYERIRIAKEKTITHKIGIFAGALAGAIAGPYVDFEDTSGEKRKRLEDFAREYAASAQEQKGTPEERQTLISKIHSLKSGISNGQTIKLLDGEIYLSFIDVLLSCAQRAAHDRPAEALNYTYFTKLREPLFIIRRELNNPQDPYFHVLGVFFSNLEKYIANRVERAHSKEINDYVNQIQRLKANILTSPKAIDPAMAELQMDEVELKSMNTQLMGRSPSEHSLVGNNSFSDTDSEIGLDETKHTNSKVLLASKLKHAELEIEELKRQLEQAKKDMSQSVSLNAQLVNRIKELEAAKSTESKASSTSTSSLNAAQYSQHGQFGGAGRANAENTVLSQTQQSSTDLTEKPKFQ